MRLTTPCANHTRTRSARSLLFRLAFCSLSVLALSSCGGSDTEDASTELDVLDVTYEFYRKFPVGDYLIQNELELTLAWAESESAVAPPHDPGPTVAPTVDFRKFTIVGIARDAREWNCGLPAIRRVVKEGTALRVWFAVPPHRPAHECKYHHPGIAFAKVPAKPRYAVFSQEPW